MLQLWTSPLIPNYKAHGYQFWYVASYEYLNQISKNYSDAFQKGLWSNIGPSCKRNSLCGRFAGV